jgi:hypothetical protein
LPVVTVSFATAPPLPRHRAPLQARVISRCFESCAILVIRALLDGGGGAYSTEACAVAVRPPVSVADAVTVFAPGASGTFAENAPVELTGMLTPLTFTDDGRPLPPAATLPVTARGSLVTVVPLFGAVSVTAGSIAAAAWVDRFVTSTLVNAVEKACVIVHEPAAGTVAR